MSSRLLTVPSTQGATLRSFAISTAPWRRLLEEQRQVLLLVGLEGMRYEEVATVLKRPGRHGALAPVARP